MEVADSVLREGARLYGADPAALHSRGGMDGAVYEYEQEGRGRILKFVPTTQDKIDQVRAKWAFADYLAQHGVRVGRPLPSESGALLEVVQGEDATWAVTLSERVPGRHPDWKGTPAYSDAIFEAWGQTLGRMHALARRYTGGAALPHAAEEVASFTDWCARACQDDAMVARWREMAETLAALPQDRAGYGVVHNDLHPWNFLVSEERGGPVVTVIDFDVCLHHWFVCDLATAFFPAVTGWIPITRPGMERAAFLRHAWERFMAGYERENVLDAAWLAHLPTFLKYRQMLLYVVFADEWQAPNEWQVETLRQWQSSILSGTPVVEWDGSWAGLEGH
ncbi:MAG: phosphotransferase enzyme family protein [Anaerolineae bacterium]